MRPTLIAIALLCASAAAQEPAPQVYRIGGGVQAPTLLSKTEPDYTEEARIAKLQGMVQLGVVIGADGSARDIRVVKSLGLGLDENAITAVSRWRFRPATRNGEAVAVMSTIEVSFRLLLDSREWYPAHVAYTVPAGASQPVLRKAPHRSPHGANEGASVRVSSELDAQGTPNRIQVEESTDPKWNSEVIALIREWRFQAATDNGTPIASRVLVDFKRGN